MSEFVRVHAPSEYPNKGYCGTNDPKPSSEDWARVTCENCLAAKRADDAVRPVAA